ncbi:Transcriptional regulator, GntR family [Azospirillum doebereinerae]
MRSAIMSGHFKPGQRLIERELCESLDVGRTSIRESLRQLEAEGLVLTVPHRGPIVSTIDYDEAEQLYAVRALLEGFAGQQLAERGTAADIARLEKAVEMFERAVEAPEPDQDALLAAKTAFYAALIEGSGNIFLRQMLTLLHNRINILRVTSMMQPGRLEHSVAEIREIYAAVKVRDGVRAAAACKHHILMAARAALAFLRQKEPA